MIPDLFRLEPASLSEGKNCLAIQGLQSRGVPIYLDAVVDARTPRDADRDQGLLERFEPHAKGEEGQARLAYLRGRIEQRAGSHAAAISHFDQALARDAGGVEPHVRLAECHQALRDHGRAESHLCRALERDGWSHKDLWDRWAHLCLCDLRLSAGEMLKRLPAERSDGPDYEARIRAFLTEFRSGGSIRMNCGGRAYSGPTGDRWIQECFFVGGHEGGVAGGDEVASSTEEAIRWSERYFRVVSPAFGYRIPLPPGRYAVTLWMGDSWFTESGKRIFDIVVEDKVLRSEYNPPVEGIDKIGETFEIADGCLDITFRHRLENPNVCGITIERVR